MQNFVKLFLVVIGLVSFHTFTFANNTPPLSYLSTLLLEAIDDTIETSINEPVSFNVLQNDTGEEIYVNLALQPSYGSLAWGVNGDFTYTPNENYVGPDVLVYQIEDNEGNTESANVFITVEGAADLPLQAIVFQDCNNSSLTGLYTVTLQVFGGSPPYTVDFLYGDDLVNLDSHIQIANAYEFLFLVVELHEGYSIIVRDEAGDVVVENDLLGINCHEDVVNTCVLDTHLELIPTVTCNEGEKNIEVVASGGSGAYTFYGQLDSNGDYIVVEDSDGCQNVLFYDEVLPAYTCPIAVDDVVNGAYNAPFHLKPLLNDIGDDLFISDISGLKHGTIQWKPDGILAYYPNEDFAGIDTLEYEITDPMGNSSRASILAVVPENDEVTIFWNRDCTRAAGEGVYEINFTVAGGRPPYVIDGDFLTSEYRGDEILNFIKSDGEDFSITAIDKDGESTTVQTNELTPCTFLSYPTSDFTVFISCVEGQDYGILTALDPFGEPLQDDFEGNSHGDTIPNSSIYSVHFSEFLEIPFEEIVFCPPIAEDDLYNSHPSYLHLPLTFNPLLNDSGHGLKLVKVESPNYGNVEWWQADGTMNYQPNTDFQGVETFDYTLEDIGGNQTSATITLIFAHPTKLKITYERDCFEVNNNEAENYTVNAFVSGGVPPYQVQVNEGAFFEVTENGGAFSFEIPNGEGFEIYADDNGGVTHTATVEELEIEACGSLCENLALEVDLECLGDGTAVLNFEVLGANGEFMVNGNQNGDILEDGEGYFVEVVDEQGCQELIENTYSTEIEAVNDEIIIETLEPIIINVLTNDKGACLELKDIIIYPCCGWLDTIDEDGTMTYSPNNNSRNCNKDSFVYLIEDVDGNVGMAEVFIHLPPSDLEVIVERDCNNTESTGIYTLNVLISNGTPPFTILGSINEVLNQTGSTSILLTDGNPYEISVVDSDGNVFFEAGGELACFPLCGVIELENINGIGQCTCDGRIVLDFNGFFGFDETIESIDGVWFDGINEVEVELGDTIPADVVVEIGGLWTNWNCYSFQSKCQRGLSVLVSSYCTPETYSLEAIDDFANTDPGEPVTITPLQNDTGTNLQINNITVSPNCGEIVDIDPATGAIVYVPDADTNCTVDTFIYQTEDECGNLAEATVTVFINDDGGEFIAQAEMDCTNVEETGVYTLYVIVQGGTPPYTISGSINETLEEGGVIFVLLEACSPYEIQVVDALGNQFNDAGDGYCVHICSDIVLDTNFVVEEGYLDCICDGSLIVSFSPLAEVEEIQSIEGFWSLDNQTYSIELGDTIPANAYFEIYEIQTNILNYQISTTDDDFLGGFTSDFCTPQTPPIPTLNESESQTSLCGAGNIVLSLEESEEGTTYNWYLDAEGTIPANPSTGQIWENDEIVDPRIIYAIATSAEACQSEPLPIETFHYENLRIEDLEIEVSENCDSYRAVFTIFGGNEVYNVNGDSSPSNYISQWMPIEDDYSFTIDDSPLIPNCEPVIISGSADEIPCCIGETLTINPSFDCLITETQDSIALLSYQATGGDGNYTFNGNPQNDSLQNGDIFQIEVMDGNGCTASIIDTVDCFFTSIENSNLHTSIPNIHLFPNPNNGNFTLSLDSKQAEDIDIEILDITGRVKTRRRLKNTATFEREDFPSGLYFIRVNGKGWTWTEKMVVK